jgi:hypothetical protein
LLRAVDFDDRRINYERQRRSFFSKWYAKTKHAASSAEVQERLRKVERALELHPLGRPQAEIDERTVKAAAELIKAIQSPSTARWPCYRV